MFFAAKGSTRVRGLIGSAIKPACSGNPGDGDRSTDSESVAVKPDWEEAVKRESEEGTAGQIELIGGDLHAKCQCFVELNGVSEEVQVRRLIGFDTDVDFVDCGRFAGLVEKEAGSTRATIPDGDVARLDDHLHPFIPVFLARGRDSLPPAEEPWLEGKTLDGVLRFGRTGSGHRDEGNWEMMADLHDLPTL